MNLQMSNDGIRDEHFHLFIYRLLIEIGRLNAYFQACCERSVTSQSDASE